MGLLSFLFGQPDEPTQGELLDHVRQEHPQVSQPWPDDNPWTAHGDDHRDWNYDHDHHKGWW